MDWHNWSINCGKFCISNLKVPADDANPVAVTVPAMPETRLTIESFLVFKD